MAILLRPKTQQVAWAAGLFEGEGTFFNGQRAGAARPYPVAAIRMCDVEPLQWFFDIVGVGTLQGPYRNNKQPGRGHEKLIYRWQCGGWESCQRIIDLFWDFLSPRRQDQIMAVYDIRSAIA